MTGFNDAPHHSEVLRAYVGAIVPVGGITELSNDSEPVWINDLVNRGVSKLHSGSILDGRIDAVEVSGHSQAPHLLILKAVVSPLSLTHAVARWLLELLIQLLLVLLPHAVLHLILIHLNSTLEQFEVGVVDVSDSLVLVVLKHVRLLGLLGSQKKELGHVVLVLLVAHIFVRIDNLRLRAGSHLLVAILPHVEGILVVVVLLELSLLMLNLFVDFSGYVFLLRAMFCEHGVHHLLQHVFILRILVSQEALQKHNHILLKEDVVSILDSL